MAARWRAWVARVAAGEAGAREVGRLALVLAGWLTIAAYLFSATAANNPYSGRYLIGLLIVTPALLWPLLEWTQGARWQAYVRNITRVVLLLLLAQSVTLNATAISQDIPNAVAANGRDARLAHDLLSHGMTRFYSDYWTCDTLNFATRERLICAVVNDYGKPGLTRYAPYVALVRADPAASYVFARGSEVERTFLLEAGQTHTCYTTSVIDGKMVYTPGGCSPGG